MTTPDVNATEGPTARRLSRADVIAAAVRVTARDGLANTTLQAVADELGVQRPSLYHHLPGGLAELHDAVATSISIGFGAGTDPDTQDPAPIPARVLAERVGVGIDRAGEAAARYPGVLEYLLTTGRHSQVSLSEAERTLKAILGSELAEQAPAAYLLVFMYVTGWSFAQYPDADTAERAGFPALAQALRTAAGLDARQLLRDGLNALLNGLAIQYNNSPDSTSGTAGRELEGDT